MISVLIVDDHTLVRETWSFILKTSPYISHVEECADGISAIVKASEYKPDVILMDINMEPISGIEASRRILEQHPGIKIIGVSTHTDAATIKRMIAAGAAGYVTKTSPVSEMIHAIQLVMEGGNYVCEELKDFRWN